MNERKGMPNELILLDDGQFYVERNPNGNPARTNGFLLRRCPRGPSTPGGYECVGGYEYCPSGAWRASINAPYDEATDNDCRSLGSEFRTYLDAIAALWHARHEAHCSH
jgi:hypothetical protein